MFSFLLFFGILIKRVSVFVVIFNYLRDCRACSTDGNLKLSNPKCKMHTRLMLAVGF
jgi:hypothetical protein